MISQYQQLDLFHQKQMTVNFPINLDKYYKVSNLYSDKLKKQFNIVKSGKLTRKATDSLYSLFGKIAKYIYRNSNWNDEELIEAVKEMYPYLGFEPNAVNSENQVIKVNFVSQRELKLNKVVLSKEMQKHVSKAIRIVSKNRIGSLLYLILVNDPKTLAKATTVYQDQNNPRANIVFYDQELLLGYDKLIRNLKKHYFKFIDKWKFDYFTLYNALTGLCAGARSLLFQRYQHLYEAPKQQYRQIAGQKKYIDQLAKLISEKQGIKIDVPENASKANQAVLQFLTAYTEKVYREIIIAQRESSAQQSTYLACMNSKNIQRSDQLLTKAKINDYFGIVDFGQQLSLTQFKVMQKDLLKLMSCLPEVKNKPMLTFCKTGKRRKCSFIYRSCRNIELDPYKSKEDVYFRTSVSYLAHDFAHNLDSNFANKQISKNLKFKGIIKRVIKASVELSNKSYVLKDLSYFLNPSEIFARCFEVYLDYLGVRSNYLTTHYLIESLDEYQLISQSCLGQVLNFFDSIYPALRKRILAEYQRTKKSSDQSNIIDLKEEGNL